MEALNIVLLLVFVGILIIDIAMSVKRLAEARTAHNILEEAFDEAIEETLKEAIKSKVLWFVEHPEQIQHMGQAAREFALKFTWDSYYDRLGTIFRSL